jgi:hypothetical protein
MGSVKLIDMVNDNNDWICVFEDLALAKEGGARETQSEMHPIQALESEPKN